VTFPFFSDTDIHKSNFESDLLQLLEPYITSARNCVVNIAYTVLVVMTTALLTHAAAFVIARRIKSTQTKKPRRKREARHKLSENGADNQTTEGHDDEGVDYDFEDSDDFCADSYLTTTDHPSNVVSDGREASNSAFSEFMYTETKV